MHYSILKLVLAIQIWNHSLEELCVLSHHEILFSLKGIDNGFEHGCLRELIFQVNCFQLIANKVIIRLVGVVELFEVVENVLDLLNVLGGDPEEVLGVLEALGFDFLDLLHGVLLLLAPGELFAEEVEDNEVEAPEVVASRKVYAVMRVQRRKRDSASEVGLLALGDRLGVLVEVALSEAEVDNVNVFVVERKHKVGLKLRVLTALMSRWM